MDRNDPRIAPPASPNLSSNKTFNIVRGLAMSEQAQHGTATKLDLELVRLWEEHVRHEFVTRSTDDTLDTMVEDAYVDHVPVLTGGCGQRVTRVLRYPFHPENAARYGNGFRLPDNRQRAACR
jgi:hypothetical protein